MKSSQFTQNSTYTTNEGQIYSTGGGAGQAYRKFVPKTEDKVANVNDGDGWRWYEPKLDEKCWDTHKQVGMKTKNGKKVPNCIPKESSILSGINKLSEEKVGTKQVNENLNDGISQEELANTLEYRLMKLYPDIVNKYGHEVVADAIMDTASFYAGATEIGTSDVSIMIKNILRKLESRSNLVDNVSEDSYRDMTDEIKKEIIKSDKMKNATRWYYYNWLLSVPVRAATSYEKFINSYAGEKWFNRHEPQIKNFADEQKRRFQQNYKIEYPQFLGEKNDNLISIPQIKLGQFTVTLKKVIRDNNTYIGFDWNSSDGKEQHEELAIKNIADYADLVREIKQIIMHKENQLKRQGKVTESITIDNTITDDKILIENLRKWFKEKWVRFGPDGKIRGSCARGDDSEGKPKCLPQAKAHSLGKKGRKYAAAKKRREDPNPERSGKAINVSTKKKSNEGVSESFSDISGLLAANKLNKSFIVTAELAEGGTKKFRVKAQSENVAKEKFMKHYSMAKIIDIKEEGVQEDQAPMFTPESKCPHCSGELVSEELMNEKKDACYYKVKSRYKVWPSAYASGALVKCRKKGASNWGTGGKSNESVVEGTKDSQDRIQELKNYIRIKERVLAGGNALSPGEQKALAQARQELKQLKKQGVAEPKNVLFVKKITKEDSLIEHAKLFAKNLHLDGVPVTSKNRHTVVCSTIFAHDKNSLNESKHITSGKQVVQLLKKLDQFSKLPIKIGSSVAIINSQLQGDSIELWGFTTPKTISKIYRDPTDNSIKQFEFNNDPNDVWPRTENAEYNGHFLMYSAFFGDKKSADHALTMLMLHGSGDLDIRNHITEQHVAEGFPYDVDHMPGKTTKHTSTNCTTCHGRKTMYKLDGKLYADNKAGATKVKCPTCKGTGDKQGVTEGNDEESYTGGSKGLPMPGTYEEENNIFKRHGARRITAMTNEEQIDEKWSDKYKRSIDCNNPKGFSQKAHCQGRKKK